MPDAFLPFSADAFDIYAMLFNLLMAIAVGGLWLMWARNMKRQKNVENMLVTTSNQLEQASRHLESALQAIHQLQKNEPQAPVKETADVNHRPIAQRDSESTTTHSGDHAENIRDSAMQNSEMVNSPTDSESDVQQILRLHNLGLQAEQIASRLEQPLARVKLLLHLNEQRSE
ncbi:MAG: hypothetical protein R8K53_06455 [Mariprofundaceae bacterium]